MEQKIMSFRLSRSGRRAIALNNQKCPFRRARTPVAKRVLVPVAALSFLSCLKPQASDSFEVDAPESSSIAKNTKSLKNKVWAVVRQLKESAQRFFRFKGGKHPVPKNDEDNHDAAAETIVDLLNKLPYDSIVVNEVTKKQLLDTLSELVSTKGLRRTQVEAMSLAMEKLKDTCVGETVPDSLIDSMARDIDISPRLLYAPRKVTAFSMRDTLRKLLSEGELSERKWTIHQVQKATSKMQFLDRYCCDTPLPDTFVESIASSLQVDPKCFLPPPPRILKQYLLDMLRKIVVGDPLTNIQRQNIQGAITWLEKKYKPTVVHNDVFEVIASRVKILRDIF